MANLGTGTVRSITATGNGPGSAQLQITVELTEINDTRVQTPVLKTLAASYEPNPVPQLFAAFASVAAAAFVSNQVVIVGWVDNPGFTDLLSLIQVPNKLSNSRTLNAPSSPSTRRNRGRSRRQLGGRGKR